MQDATGPSDAREMLDANLNMSRAREAQLRALALLRNISDPPAPTDETALSDAEGPARLRALADLTEDTQTLKPHHINVDSKAYATQSKGFTLKGAHPTVKDQRSLKMYAMQRVQRKPDIYLMLRDPRNYVFPRIPQDHLNAAKCLMQRVRLSVKFI